MSAVAVEHVGPWTVEDVLALPEDGQRHELIDGSLLVTPAPGYPHQRASSWLWHALQIAAPAEFEVFEAVNVQAGSTRLFIPDVVVTRCPGTMANVLPASEVLLVAEIVSPSSVSIDRTLKPALYAAAGISHFLRIELDGSNGPSISAYTLAGDTYRESASARGSEIFSVDEPFPVSIDPLSLVARRR